MASRACIKVGDLTVRKLSHDETIRRLAIRCTKWGGRLIRVSREDYDLIKNEVPGYLAAQYTMKRLGLLWEQKLIFYANPVSWEEVIHELGHVFACKKHPEHKSCKEYDFLGWEMALAQIIDGSLDAWFKSNKDYEITDNGIADKHLIQYLNEKERELLAEDRLKHASEIGLLSDAGVPIPIR